MLTLWMRLRAIKSFIRLDCQDVLPLGPFFNHGIRVFRFASRVLAKFSQKRFTEHLTVLSQKHSRVGKLVLLVALFT